MWRHVRLAFQLPLAPLAAIVILDGLRGPQVGAMNLAGVLPWIHWRGLVDGFAGGRQRILHGVSVHAAPHARPPWCRRLELAAPTAKQVVGRPPVRSFCGRTKRLPCGTAPGGLRGSSSPTSRRLRRGRLVPRCLLLRVSVSDRSVQLRAVVGLPAGSSRSRPAGLRGLQDEGLHPWTDGVPGCEMDLFAAKAGNMDCTFVSIVSTPVPTTTSGYSPTRQTSEMAQDPSRPASAGSRPARPGGAVLVLVFGALRTRGNGRPGGAVADSFLVHAGPAVVAAGGEPVFCDRSDPCAGPHGRLCCRPEPVVGVGLLEQGRGNPAPTGHGDSLLLYSRSSWIRHVARALQLSLPNELRRGGPRDAAVPDRPRLHGNRTAGLGSRLPPACRCLVASFWKSFS